MQSRGGRLLVILVSVVVAVAAFLVLQPSDDEEETAGTPTATATVAPSEAPTAGATPTATPEETPTPEALTIRVRNGKPVGGEAEIEVEQGERVEFSVQSDAADEVHVHGYDIKRDVAPGKRARFRFKADLTGVFEVELEHVRVAIASLKVEP